MLLYQNNIDGIAMGLYLYAEQILADTSRGMSIQRKGKDEQFVAA